MWSWVPVWGVVTTPVPESHILNTSPPGPGLEKGGSGVGPVRRVFGLLPAHLFRPLGGPGAGGRGLGRAFPSYREGRYTGPVSELCEHCVLS